MLATFEKTRAKNPEVSDLQDACAVVFRDIVSKEVLDGRLIENIAITTGTEKTINHGLGRAIRGWIVTRTSAGATVWDSQSNNTTPRATLVLNASANVTISIWVF